MSAKSPEEPSEPSGAIPTGSVPTGETSASSSVSDPPTSGKGTPAVPAQPSRAAAAPEAPETSPEPPATAPVKAAAPAKAPPPAPAKAAAPVKAPAAVKPPPPKPNAILKRPRPPRPPRTGSGATLLGFASLAVAIVAVLVGLFALGEAQDARRLADQALASASASPAAAGPTTQPTAVPTTAVPTRTATAEPTGSPPALAPVLAYPRQELRVLGATCYDTIFIDIDEPRVGPPDPADVYVSNFGCSTGTPPELYLNRGVSASQATAGLTPAMCADLAGRASPDPNFHSPLRPGVMMCVRTATKVALIEVVDVAPNNMVTMQVTGWTL